jgi:hypothetical protein
MTPHIDALSAGSIEDAVSNFRNASHLSLILSDVTLLTAGGASCIESLNECWRSLIGCLSQRRRYRAYDRAAGDVAV